MRYAMLTLAIVLAGCSSDAPPPERNPELPPVVVYSAYEDTSYLPALFKAFTDQSGVPVVVRHRTDEANLADMAAKSGSQPADVLLTRSIWSVWEAADEGLLRPLPPEAKAKAIARGLQDPDGKWVALTVREVAVQVADDVEVPAGFLELADPAYRGRLCLSASSIHQNRVLVAHLIDVFGARDTELAVRGWIANLALPPFETEAELQKAFAEGRCGVGIRTGPNNPSFQSRAALIEIEGLGIGRHARSPEDAAALIDWMLSDAFLGRHANLANGLPASSDAFRQLENLNMARLGFLYEDAVKLVERARWY
ncbi:MAG: extracellular solute-binding protein [Pseudomonadota bacterium]